MAQNKFIEHIDPREIDEKEILGKGSFGLVIRAEWRGRDVALKVLYTHVHALPLTALL